MKNCNLSILVKAIDPKDNRDMQWKAKQKIYTKNSFLEKMAPQEYT